jgi:hypothetical protein
MMPFTLREWNDGGCSETFKIACELGPELRYVSASLLQRHLVITLDLARHFMARMEAEGLIESFETMDGGTGWHWVGAPWEREHLAFAPMIAWTPRIDRR